MVAVRAEVQEKARVVFTSRARSTVNVIQPTGDGPLGFSSMELLLIALANCSLETLLSHPLLIDEPVYAVNAIATANRNRKQAGAGWVHLEIQLTVEDEGLVRYAGELQRIAVSGAACGWLNAELTARVHIETQRDVASRFLPPLAAQAGASY